MNNGDPTKPNPDYVSVRHGDMMASGFLAGVRFVDVWDAKEERVRRFFNLDTPEQFEALRGVMVIAMAGDAADASAPAPNTDRD